MADGISLASSVRDENATVPNKPRRPKQARLFRGRARKPEKGEPPAIGCPRSHRTGARAESARGECLGWERAGGAICRAGFVKFMFFPSFHRLVLNDFGAFVGLNVQT